MTDEINANLKRLGEINDPFPLLLCRAGILKSELARRLGITPNSVSNWKDSPPKYAVAYLELLIEYNRVRP